MTRVFVTGHPLEIVAILLAINLLHMCPVARLRLWHTTQTPYWIRSHATWYFTLIGSEHRPDPSHWIDYFDLLRIYIDKPQRSIILLKYKGYYNPQNRKWAIPSRHTGSGRGTGWPCYVKYPLVINQLHMRTTAGLRPKNKVQTPKLLVGTAPYLVNFGIWNNRVMICIGNRVMLH